MKYFSRMALEGAVIVALLAAFPLPANAVGPEDIVGTWKMVTNVNGRDLESDVVFELKDGALVGVARSQGGGRGQGGGGGRGPGARELLDVQLEGDTLSWGIIMRQAGNTPLRTTVKVTGESFEGSITIPFGEGKVTGKKWTAEAERQLTETIKAMLGDWDIITTYEGQDTESTMRLFLDEEQDLRLAILMPGATLDVRRVRFDGTNLSFSTNMPFIGGEPVRGQMKIADLKCEGVISSPLGDIPIRGELIDTAKLVLAPYDDPKPILGAWDVTASVRGEESKVKLAIEPDGERLKGIVETSDGKFESSEVDYRKVGDSMGRLRLSIVIPSLGEKPQTFELIFSGDGFEGEEIHSNGEIYFEGTRAAG
ncbi:MAG: hypothetical protein HUU46_08160 [Candidatus Hydrogenedentes bacterium]|nr:hypothetical protein [Candidatus Hydrogenedentota bacterium]